jgi:sugar/nucleoside kinase (ribokinase family)
MSDVGAGAHRVLVVGDLNPDLVLTGDVVPRFGQVEQLLDRASLTIGGSAAITAHGLARLGRAVSLVAAVGQDSFGDRLLDELSEAGVDVDQTVRRDDVPTGLTVVLSDRDDRAILTLPGAIPTLTAAEVAGAVAATRARGLAHLHVASLFLQPGLAAELPALLRSARAAGLTTSLDTNDDPGGQWHGVDPLLPHLDVFLPNRAEVVAIGRDADPHRAARTLAGRGPLVVVKDGADGAFATRPDGEVVRGRGPRRQPVDTTGAGDTFDAAFLDGWLDGSPLDDCLHRAALAGAFAVGALGGTAGQPTRDDLLHQGRTHEH